MLMSQLCAGQPSTSGHPLLVASYLDLLFFLLPSIVLDNVQPMRPPLAALDLLCQLLHHGEVVICCVVIRDIVGSGTKVRSRGTKYNLDLRLPVTAA